jgi:hypothetical protein
MFRTGLSRGFLVLALCPAAGTLARAQSSVEHGSATSVSGTAAANAKPLFPKIVLPSVKPSQPGASATGKPAALPDPDEAAANNKLALERSAGPDASETTLRSTPDHALAWVDMRFVGATPITMKLAAGRHRLRMSAPNLQPVDKDVELKPKQPETIVLALAPRVTATAASPR